MNSIVSFAYNNPVVAFVFALGLLFFAVRKPKLFFSLFFLGLLLAGLFYLIMSTAGSGSQHKKRLIHEDRQVDIGG